jgi:hypothetical protein
VLALVTGQALAGQSIVQPSAPVVAIAVTLFAAATVASTATLRRESRRGR